MSGLLNFSPNRPTSAQIAAAAAQKSAQALPQPMAGPAAPPKPARPRPATAGKPAPAMAAAPVAGMANTTPAAMGAPAAAAPQMAAGAAAPCRVTYRLTQAATTFTVTMTIANIGAAQVKGWALRWAFPPGQPIIYGFNAMVTNDANGGVATNLGQNRVIPAGGTTTIGFVTKRTAMMATPTSFTLNGAMCQGQPVAAAAAQPAPAAS
jgi:hypothetical protein